MLGLGIYLGSFRAAIQTKRVSMSIIALIVSVPTRRDWKGLVISFTTGTGWSASLGLLGFWIVSNLEQPEWEEGEDIQAATRVVNWGFNYFQKVVQDAQ